MGEVEGKDGGREADERLGSKREGTSDKGVEVDRKKEGERKKGEIEGCMRNPVDSHSTIMSLYNSS